MPAGVAVHSPRTTPAGGRCHSAEGHLSILRSLHDTKLCHENLSLFRIIHSKSKRPAALHYSCCISHGSQMSDEALLINHVARSLYGQIECLDFGSAVARVLPECRPFLQEWHVDKVPSTEDLCDIV